MAFHYPDMPLNVQLSFGYSRFLDLHLYNINAIEYDSEHYALCRILAYKEISSFSYTSACSNIHDCYKHTVVPVTLHRIHTRNILKADIDNHLHFMYKILQTRLQNPVEVKRKTRNFFLKKRKTSGAKRQTKPTFQNSCVVRFDRVTGRHVFLRTLLRRSLVKLSLIHTSGRRLASLLCPKRRVIKILSNVFNN